ncbi:MULTISPECIES: DUF4287 domain-containing protein [Streptomyces]|uniref:DUF4287 domain-containing protein n=1 Tax=Streptomyces fimbriatus TaxID=68197 RepID=A0ABW0D910_STRFI
MSRGFSEETRRTVLARVPHCTGRGITDWLRTVAEGPAPRFEEKAGRLRHGYDPAYGHAEAIIHEHDLGRAARTLLPARVFRMPGTTKGPG